MTFLRISYYSANPHSYRPLTSSSVLARRDILKATNSILTITVASGLERPPHELEVVGSIPNRDRQKSLKLVVVTFLLGALDYGNTTVTGPPLSR